MALQASHTHCDVAVVGGGLGGLALAAGLAARGYRAHVYEAAKQLRTSTSTLIGLGGNGFTALTKLHPGIVPQLKQRGVLAEHRAHVVRLSKAEPLQHMPMPPSSAELWTMRWSEVQQVLAGLVPAELVHCQHRAGQPDVRARFVVAADGLRSALRANMVPGDTGPRYLGHMNWNALLYNPGGSVVDAHKPGEIQVWVDSNTPGQFKNFMYVIDAGGGYSFWQLRIQSDEPSFTPDPQQQQHQAGGGDGGSELMLKDEQPHLVGGGLGRPGSKARVLARLEAAGFDGPMALVQATPESAIFERAMLDRLPLDEVHGSMSSPGGRVVLLGDAAHAMHSGPGQGARTAFEDAHQLMEALERHRHQLQGWAFSRQQPDFTPPEQPASSNVEGLSDLVASISTTGTDHGKTTESAGTSQGAAAAETADGPAAGGNDQPALRAVVGEYETARLVRTCRVQRYAAEGCGLGPLKEALRPAGITAEQVAKRRQEFVMWIERYPEQPQGDPNSVWWKPPST